MTLELQAVCEHHTFQESRELIVIPPQHLTERNLQAEAMENNNNNNKSQDTLTKQIIEGLIWLICLLAVSK